MTWADQRQKNDWRSCLTKAEASIVSSIESKLEDIDATRQRLLRERQLIQNRATVRYKRQVK
mgnify:CR=1 FL=1